MSLRRLVPDGGGALFAGSGGPPVGVALGVALAAFQVVELVALAVPSLRWRRSGGPRGRVALNRGAVALALVLALLWPALGAFVQASDLGWATAIPAGAAALLTPTRVVAALLHMLLVALVLALGAAVSRYGLGNGLSLFIGLEAAAMIARRAEEAATSAGAALALRCGAAVVLGVVGVGSLLLTTLRWSARRFGAGAVSGSEPSGLLCPSAGVVALQFASFVSLLPATLANLGLAPAAVWGAACAPGSTGYASVLAAATLVGAVAFSWLFYRPALLARLRLPEAGADRSGATSRLNHSFRLALGVTLAFYAGCLLLQHAVTVVAKVGLPLLASLLAAAITADLWLEGRARAAGPLLKVWELHQPYAQAVAREVLLTSARRFHLRAANHRALGLFFAPYAPIEVLVDEASAAQAAQALAQRLVAAHHANLRR
ncbi:MAG: hypothetical protein IPL40_07375 [Proteobacteria bacterium]|nr:hypothetical protein [Pseudomonadota bacterium]